MQTINIHEVSSITLSEVSSFDETSHRPAFNVRRLTIIDNNGYKIDIELFSSDLKALTINADWNNGQLITV
jgi:hypothetical protein